jgi:hypothetical protein
MVIDGPFPLTLLREMFGIGAHACRREKRRLDCNMWPKPRKCRPEILSDAALCTGSPVSVSTGNPPAER